MTEIRDILITVCKELEGIDEFVAKGLKYEREIYVSPGVVWLESGAPLELQVYDGGETTLDRDGSVRRGQISVGVAILMRRPTQFQGQHATVLSSLNDDLQTYARAIRATLDGNFLETALILGDDPVELLVRPLVYWSSTTIQNKVEYPDLLVKEMGFTVGLNDAL